MNLDELRKDFISIEKERFSIINSYIMGSVKCSQIDGFEKDLFNFMEKLYNYQCDDENLMEIANMKSKVQHFCTEVLEDEDLLRCSYINEN